VLVVSDMLFFLF
jgi:hypothetical protein